MKIFESNFLSFSAIFKVLKQIPTLQKILEKYFCSLHEMCKNILSEKPFKIPSDNSILITLGKIPSN